MSSGTADGVSRKRGRSPSPDAPPSKKGGAAEALSSKCEFAVVCSSNMNRSMEAHNQFQRKGLRVRSYGVGTKVRLPGPTSQNVFDFGTPYTEIKKVIKGVDYDWYNERGLVGMLERNVRLKHAPERWQDIETSLVQQFAVVFCFEERVFDILVEDVRDNREQDDMKVINVVNLDVTDNPEEAVTGAHVALEFCQLCENVEGDLDDSLPDIIEQIETQHGVSLLHQTLYL